MTQPQPQPQPQAQRRPRSRRALILWRITGLAGSFWVGYLSLAWVAGLLTPEDDVPFVSTAALACLGLGIAFAGFWFDGSFAQAEPSTPAPSAPEPPPAG